MSSDIAVSVRNLTKIYRIFAHPADRLKQALTFGRVPFHRQFTALEDVSFDVKKGETVGIIGRNGSGKSTLLQLICGILKPTAGLVQVNGRVSALLELGSGFNPEFTGRENVFFQGAIMGLSREEMAARFDDIAAFADIGEFIDQPVRTYSSGMFVRLAFATSIHVDPDILVIDEALTVGDMVFQRKCFERLGQLLSSRERVVLLVSHDIRQVERFCSRVVFLREGRVIADSSAQEVCQLYYGQVSCDMNEAPAVLNSSRAKITSSGEAELRAIAINDHEGQGIPEIRSGDPVCVKVRFKLFVPVNQPEFIIGTQAADLLYLSSSSTAELNAPLNFRPGEHVIEYLLDQFPLAPGHYFIRFGIRDEHYRLMFAAEGLAPFVVVSDSFEAKRPTRLLNLKTEWIIGGEHYSVHHNHSDN